MQLVGRKERVASTGGGPPSPPGGVTDEDGRPAKRQVGPWETKKKPERVCARLERWVGSEMRRCQRRDTHLKRQSDLAGRRVRMSTTRSSGR